MGAAVIIELIVNKPSSYKDWVELARTNLSAKISFDQFLSYFKIAPNEWELSPTYCYHLAEDKHHIYIYFSKRDYKKYQKFYKEYTDPSNKGAKALIFQVQEDIDKARAIALQEKEKGINQLNEYLDKQLMKGGN